MRHDVGAILVGLSSNVVNKFLAHELDGFPINIGALFLADYVSKSLTEGYFAHGRRLVEFRQYLNVG